MIKKVNYMLIAFTFSFLCFVSSVNAADSVYGGTVDISSAFNVYDNFTDEQLLYINNYLTNYFDELGLENVLCSSYLKYFDVNFGIYCNVIESDFDVHVKSYYNYIRFLKLTNSNIYSFYFNSSKNEFNSPSSYVASNHFLLFYDAGNGYGPVFWASDSYKTLAGDSFIIDDTEYSEISDNYKKYYDFKNYLVPGMPIYSIMDLRFGTWKGNSNTVTLNYCYDNVCDSNDKEVINYKYANNGDEIDLSEYISETRNDYKLDYNHEYKIKAGEDESVNIYYYSVSIPYVVNYYYDDVLQESLTQELSGTTGDTIILKDLELVKDNIYFLDESKDYSITLKSGESNIINVYYYSKDISYSVNVYLDDIYYQSHSYTSIGKVGSEIILENLVETINIYTLDEREYKVLLSENQETNYINVYYYSENYDTKYQDIDTSDKFYIAFDWVYIKDLFGLNGLYTQTEQFVIVYVVNFLFYAIVCIFGYFGLKMINKLFSLFKMF